MTTPDMGVIDRLARMDEKLNQLLHRDDDHEARLRQLEQPRIDPHDVDHESRLRRLERVVWLAAGAALAGGGAAGTIASLIIRGGP